MIWITNYIGNNTRYQLLATLDIIVKSIYNLLKEFPVRYKFLNFVLLVLFYLKQEKIPL